MKKAYNGKNRTADRFVSFVLVFCITLCALSCGSRALAEDIIVVDFESGTLESFIGSPGSGVSVKSERNSKILNISPQNDGTAAYARHVIEIQKNVPVKIAYDYRINDCSNNENVIADISQGAQKMLEIKTSGKNFLKTDKYGEYASFAQEGAVNRWHTIELTVDFSEEKYSVAIDGEKVIDNEGLCAALTPGIEPIYISMSAKYAPGIAIDNFTVGNIQKMKSIIINGNENINIAEATQGSEIYSAEVLDARGVAIENAEVTATVLPQDGVTVETDKNTVTVTFSESAAAQSYVLYVTYGAKTATKRIFLKRYTPQPSKISISGSARLGSYTRERSRYEYTATVYDSNGAEFLGRNIKWSLQGDNIPQTLSLDTSTGVITVTGELPKDEHIILRAELSDNNRISATKKLTLQDTRTFVSDTARYSVLNDYMNKILDIGKDNVNNTPLIPWVLNRYTQKPGVWTLNNGEFTPSDLASMGNFYRTGEIMNKLTGETRFTDHMYELYQYYLDYYWNEEPGLFTWGGHSVINYDDATKHFGYGSRIQELKTHGPYMDPFFKLNPEIARKEIISTWEHLIEKGGWKTMAFNRHAYHSVKYTENDWLNTNNGYIEPDLTRGYNPNMSTSISFFSTECDLLNFACDLYRNTTDQKEKDRIRTWVMRMKKSFWACSDPNTQFYQNTSAGMPSLGEEYAAPNTKNPNEVYPNWWEMSKLPSGVTNATYGDRFYNQYAEDLIAQGYVEDTIENRTKIMECCTKFTYAPEGKVPFSDWYCAETLGLDTEEGALIWQRAMRALGNVVKYGYDEDTNQLHNMLADGTRITGLVSSRPGYYGNAGKVFTSSTPGPGTVLPYAFAYAKSLTVPQSARSATYDEDLENIYKLVRGGMKGLGCGEIGVEYLGDRAKISCASTQIKYTAILAVLHLYEASENTEFLDLARNMANKMISTLMTDGMFALPDKTNARYLYLYGEPSQYAWILAYLEALILGEDVSEFYFQPYEGYYEDYGWYGDNEIHMNSVSSGTMWGTAYTAVAPQRIDVAETEITLNVGETYELDYTVEPDDASNKSVIITTSDASCVQVGVDNAQITAVHKGTAGVAIKLSADRRIKTVIKVNVKEE